MQKLISEERHVKFLFHLPLLVGLTGHINCLKFASVDFCRDVFSAKS